MGRVTSYDYSGINVGQPQRAPSSSPIPTATRRPTPSTRARSVEDHRRLRTPRPSSTTYDVDPSTLLDDSVTDAERQHDDLHLRRGRQRHSTRTNPLGKTWTSPTTPSTRRPVPPSPSPLIPCSSLSPPSAITAGTATITPPCSAATQVRHLHRVRHRRQPDLPDDRRLRARFGVGFTSRVPPTTSTTASRSRSDSIDDSCTNTAPSTELPCATIDPDGVVTQLAYDSAGDLTSSSTPDGNAGGEVAETTYGYDTDGELTSARSHPTGTSPGPTPPTSPRSTSTTPTARRPRSRSAARRATPSCPATTTYSYDADGNSIASHTEPTSPGRVGGASWRQLKLLAVPQLARPARSPATRWCCRRRPRRHPGSETVTTPSGYTLSDRRRTG